LQKRGGTISALKAAAPAAELTNEMVSDHDAQLLRQFYEALNEGDFEAAMDLCNQEVEVYQPPEVVAALPARGQRDVTEYLREFFGTWHMYRPEPEDFVESGDKVVALVNLRARGLGSRFEIQEEIADVFEVSDGKISKLRLYVHRDTALAHKE
jgi:ketosteroid isomerase-like protein